MTMRPPIHPVAGMARILQHEELSDGRYLLVLEGVARVRIENQLDSADPYRICDSGIRNSAVHPRESTVVATSQTPSQLRLILELLAMKPEDDARVLPSPSSEICCSSFAPSGVVTNM